jgi:hypothetical protein
MSENTDWIIIAVYGDSDPLRAAYGNDPMGDDEDIPGIAEKAFGAARLAVATGKSTENLEWDEEVGTVAPPRTPTPAKNLVKSSDERFARVSAKIREIFGPDHMDEAEEAIALAEELRKETRAEFIATH